jgi:AraC family transcriptional regulator
VPQIPQLWARFERDLDRLGALMQGSETYGVVASMTGESDCFRYLCGFRLVDREGPPDEYEVIEIPAQTYVVFVHSGRVSDLPATCRAIWHDWLPGSGERPTATPDFIEVYGDRFDPATGSGEVEVWVPVQD